MIEIVRFKPWRVVSKSKNLRGILTYARKHGIKSAHTMRTVGGYGWLSIYFADGAFCKAHFQSHSVLESWLAARRSWKLKKLQDTNPIYSNYEVTQ